MKQKGKGRKTVNKEGSNMGRCSFRREGRKKEESEKDRRISFFRRGRRGDRG